MSIATNSFARHAETGCPALWILAVVVRSAQASLALIRAD